MARIGPVILTSDGDTFTPGAQIATIVWSGATTAGDIVRVVCRTTGTLIWEGRATGTQTYSGVAFGGSGTPAPNGFVLQGTTGGRVLVYLNEA